VGLAIWVYFGLLGLGCHPCLALVVELLFSILLVRLSYQSLLNALASQLGLLFVAVVCLRLLLRLGVLLIVEELLEVLVAVAGLAVVNWEVLARG
jgi:hypothetical protein